MLAVVLFDQEAMKNKHAVALAKLRAASLTAARRSEIARIAALARWGKPRTR